MTLTKARLSMMVVVTTFVGFWLGAGSAGFGWRMVHTILGTTLTAFGAAVFNQLMEMGPDAKMHRTADRPLPGRRIRTEFAFGIGWVGAVGGADTGGPAIFHWRIFFDQPAIFLFALLFLWQLPHFLAINWMYREEYIRGGFVMWSNDDESGTKTSKLAIFYSVLLMLLAVHPWLAGFASPWFTVLALLAGGWLVFLAVKFHSLRDRASARRLFLNTLLYLPIVLVALCLLARIVPHPQP